MSEVQVRPLRQADSDLEQLFLATVSARQRGKLREYFRQTTVVGRQEGEVVAYVVDAIYVLLENHWAIFDGSLFRDSKIRLLENRRACLAPGEPLRCGTFQVGSHVLLNRVVRKVGVRRGRRSVCLFYDDNARTRQAHYHQLLFTCHRDGLSQTLFTLPEYCPKPLPVARHYLPLVAPQ